MTPDVRDLLESALPLHLWSTSSADLKMNARDQAPVLDYHDPIAVVWAETIDHVQATLRVANSRGVPIVCRGAGTGISGGAHATKGCIVLSLERMNRILELNADDETAVVEPGVINADLNEAAATVGLMYAPDPASFRISTVGGNVATNAGGLRCAKYGVTRDSVLALDVVLADGTLIHTGHRTFKGVAGYDLTGLFVGSEGTLGVVVGITVRLKYLPVKLRTIAAFFPDFKMAAAGVLAVGRARVQPTIMELLDAPTLEAIDGAAGSNLAKRGQALLLIQTDGYGADLEAEIITRELIAIGGSISAETPDEAEQLVELRRNSRGDGTDDEFRVGEDVAVPRSQIVKYIAELQRIAAAHDVNVKVVAHAGDGNMHPTFWVDREQGNAGVDSLQKALDESVEVALAAGGTITGEHGIGQYKLRWLSKEISNEVRELQQSLKGVFDPKSILNPGKAI